MEQFPIQPRLDGLRMVVMNLSTAVVIPHEEVDDVLLEMGGQFSPEIPKTGATAQETLLFNLIKLLIKQDKLFYFFSNLVTIACSAFGCFITPPPLELIKDQFGPEWIRNLRGMLGAMAPSFCFFPPYHVNFVAERGRDFGMYQLDFDWKDLWLQPFVEMGLPYLRRLIELGYGLPIRDQASWVYLLTHYISLASIQEPEMEGGNRSTGLLMALRAQRLVFYEGCILDHQVKVPAEEEKVGPDGFSTEIQIKSEELTVPYNYDLIEGTVELPSYSAYWNECIKIWNKSSRAYKILWVRFFNWFSLSPKDDLANIVCSMTESFVPSLESCAPENRREKKILSSRQLVHLILSFRDVRKKASAYHDDTLVICGVRGFDSAVTIAWLAGSKMIYDPTPEAPWGYEGIRDHRIIETGVNLVNAGFQNTRQMSILNVIYPQSVASSKNGLIIRFVPISLAFSDKEYRFASMVREYGLFEQIIFCRIWPLIEHFMFTVTTELADQKFRLTYTYFDNIKKYPVCPISAWSFGWGNPRWAVREEFRREFQVVACVLWSHAERFGLEQLKKDNCERIRGARALDELHFDTMLIYGSHDQNEFLQAQVRARGRQDDPQSDDSFEE